MRNVVLAAIAVACLLGGLVWVWMMSTRGMPEAGDLHDGARMADQPAAGGDVRSIAAYRTRVRDERTVTPPSYRSGVDR